VQIAETGNDNRTSARTNRRSYCGLAESQRTSRHVGSVASGLEVSKVAPRNGFEQAVIESKKAEGKIKKYRETSWLRYGLRTMSKFVLGFGVCVRLLLSAFH